MYLNDETFELCQGILINSFIQKLIDDKRYDAKFIKNRLVQVYDDLSLIKYRRCGWYGWLEYNDEVSIASSMDCLFKMMFPSFDWNVENPVARQHVDKIWAEVAGMGRMMEFNLNKHIRNQDWIPWTSEERIETIRKIDPDYTENPVAFGHNFPSLIVPRS